jgi:glucose-1-phosphate adenylyltransferase
VHVLPPYQQASGSDWYKGTANAIYQNISFIESYDPEYVIILSGDQICKQDYSDFLRFHKQKNAEFSVAVMEVPWEETHRFGLAVTREDDSIIEFQEKPKDPKSNLASMGIYIFNWKTLRNALVTNKEQPNLDFGKHIIPYCRDNGSPLYAYEFNGYWKDVGTLTTYWETNMELTSLVPDFNLYEEFWQIYTSAESHAPAYLGADAQVTHSIVGDGSEIHGIVKRSVLGSNVIVGAGAKVIDSILMNGVVIEEGAVVRKAIIAENTVVGKNTRIGEGTFEQSRLDPKVYNSDLAVIGAGSVIPADVTIGKNTAISGVTGPEDYPEGNLISGGYILKKEEKR